MTFKEYKSICIEYIKKNEELFPIQKQVMIDVLKKTIKRVHSDILYNYAIEPAIKMYRCGDITLDEYSDFYFKMENYF